MPLQFNLNGQQVEVSSDNPRRSLLDVLRSECGITSAKDGCAPQGQCGCCTVLVDGKARVSCVTPVRRVAGRDVTTVEGLDPDVAAAWADRLAAHGGSQCGFCTPGIVIRLEERRERLAAAALGDGSRQRDASKDIERALAAHLCRCTGWQGICETAAEVFENPVGIEPRPVSPHDSAAGARRAALEGGHPQRVDRAAVLGSGGFAADTALEGALVAMLSDDGEWVVGETHAEAREAARRVQGRRTTLDAEPPLSLPDGDWDATLRTSWVEPAYLETDASWCEPGGEPADPLANAGAFGGKEESPLPAIARELADTHGRAVLALWTREDVVRNGPKRPPVAIGLRSDGGGSARVLVPQRGGVDASEVADVMQQVLPGLVVESAAGNGPPTSLAGRAAGWAEAFCVAVAGGVGTPFGGVEGNAVTVTLPTGGRASVAVLEGAGSAAGAPVIEVDVDAGDPLDEAVLRSYVTGAVHMAAGWVTSEGLAVDPAGEVQDLTIRSFGILPANALPHVEVRSSGSGEPVGISDAVFAATAAAVWRHHGFAGDWPLGTGVLSVAGSR